MVENFGLKMGSNVLVTRVKGKMENREDGKMDLVKTDKVFGLYVVVCGLLSVTRAASGDSASGRSVYSCRVGSD
jgi:hypothetical protein